jgi:thioredoxin reductase (NADPH)
VAERPYLVVVDDEPEVRVAVARDVRTKYGEDYSVVDFTGGREAIEGLKQLHLQGDSVALILSDQRMPELTGVELLEASRDIYPEARRALLTAYSDTEAAIAAINRAAVDYYIQKPWEPPEERLYPTLDDLLERWEGAYVMAYEGVRVIGARWSRDFHDLQAFLIRNQVPFTALDVDKDSGARRMLNVANLDPAVLPVVLFADGTDLVQPSPAQLAAQLGVAGEPTRPSYDLVIVGGGPAGLAAAVYGASEGLSTLLLEREAPGGQAGQSARIENYLGFPVGLSGSDLARRAVTQARRFGAELLIPVEVDSMKIEGPFKTLELTDGRQLTSRAVVVATGVSYRKLDVPGCEELTGAGVYYGASQVEANIHRDEDMLILGGGNSAGQAAVYLAGFARSVIILLRTETIEEGMSQYLVDQLGQISNVSVRTEVEVTGVNGKARLEAVDIQAVGGGSEETLDAAALFIFIGQVPRTDWLDGQVMRDSAGFILTGADCGERPAGWTLARQPLGLESSLPGVFVAGDVRHGSIKRVASAVGEGAMAVRMVHEHLAGS